MRYVTCRFCFKELNPHDECSSILEASLRIAIDRIFTFQTLFEKDLPLLVCHTCTSTVWYIYEYSLLVQTNQNKLLEKYLHKLKTTAADCEGNDDNNSSHNGGLSLSNCALNTESTISPIQSHADLPDPDGIQNDEVFVSEYTQNEEMWFNNDLISSESYEEYKLTLDNSDSTLISNETDTSDNIQYVLRQIEDESIALPEVCVAEQCNNDDGLELHQPAKKQKCLRRSARLSLKSISYDETAFDDQAHLKDGNSYLPRECTTDIDVNVSRYTTDHTFVSESKSQLESREEIPMERYLANYEKTSHRSVDLNFNINDDRRWPNDTKCNSMNR